MVAIIDSMTPAGASQPHDYQRCPAPAHRASGSGTSVQEVNALLKQYAQARKMMKSFLRRAARGQETPRHGQFQTAEHVRVAKPETK